MPMMNRRDQAQAYRFLTRRLSAALIRDEADSPDAPMHKLGIASFSSVMVALLACAVFGVIGLLHPAGSTAWKDGTSLILEKETGTRYIYTGRLLHPVLNFASARLVLGQSAVSIVSVSQASLRGTPRGLPIGIPGAPDELPDPTALVRSPWSICSLPSVDQAGDPQPYVRLSVGTAPRGKLLAAGQGLLVAGPDGTIYLVWNGQRLRVAGGNPALTALSYASARPVLVGDAWLSAVPQGADLAAPAIPGTGSAGVLVAGHRSFAGQVFAARGPGRPPQYYAAYRDGLAPISAVQADLLLASPGTRNLYAGGVPAPIRITATAAAAATASAAAGTGSGAGLPATPPALLTTGNGQLAACAVYAAGRDNAPTLETYPVAASSVLSAPAATQAQGAALADQVVIPPGGGAVVQPLAAPGVTSPTVYLVTDQGTKYPLSGSVVLAALGLPGVRPARVPAAVLQLLPTGPTLDQHAATLTSSP